MYSLINNIGQPSVESTVVFAFAKVKQDCPTLFNEMKNKICGIYKITNPKGKIYIGQSVDIKNRLSKYRNCNCKEQPHLYNSLKKYGWDRHIFEVTHQCKQEELNTLEIYYIELFQCFNTKHGLNLHSGGNNHVVSDITRRKIKIALKGKNKGAKSQSTINNMRIAALNRSKEANNNISKSLKGKYTGSKNSMYGKSHTEESKNKLRQAALNNIVKKALLTALDKTK